MAHLAIPHDRDWTDPGAVAGYRIADYACGTGELLTAVYRRTRELHRDAGGDPAEIHQRVMAESITAMDILPASTCMAAAALDELEDGPSEPGGATRAVTAWADGGNGKGNGRKNPPRKASRADISLGSLDLLDEEVMRTRKLQPIGRNGTGEIRIEPHSQDLVIMNPPFSRITKPQDIGLGTPAGGRHKEPTRYQMELARKRMEDIQKSTRAGNKNGLAYYFSHLADRMVKPGGTIALLLPESALSGGGGGPYADRRSEPQGWQVFRENIARNYRGITVVGIAAYENQQSTFSDDTTIAEIMLTARRLRRDEAPEDNACFVTLRRQPRNPGEAARIARCIRETRQAMREDRQQEAHLMVDGENLGTATAVRLPGGEIWAMARTIKPEIMRAAGEMGNGMIRLEHEPAPMWLPMAPIAGIARIGIGDYDVRNLLMEVPDGQGGFPTLRNHNSALHRAMETRAQHEMMLRPGHEGSRRRLEESMSRLHLNDTFRYNSQPTAACLTPGVTLGGRNWPNARLDNEQYEKALALWMNSTPGLLGHWALSNHTQNGLGYLSLTQLKKLPVLDVTRLTEEQIEMAAQLFEETRGTPMLAANEAWRDPVRQEIDRRLLREILGFRTAVMRRIEKLRNQWCLEPTVLGRKGATQHRQDDLARLTDLAERDEREPSLAGAAAGSLETGGMTREIGEE